MRALDQHTAERNEYEHQEVVKTRRWEAFKGSEAHKECLQTGFERACCDLDKVVEAIGPDGRQYSFDTNMLAASDVKRMVIRAQINAADAEYYTKIASAIINDDAAELGRLILENAKPYLMKEAEEFVSNSWEEWL